jgi:uncharacterized metal-binding protein YceD (DUF177 family)
MNDTQKSSTQPGSVAEITYRVDAVPAAGISASYKAGEQERVALARQLDLPAISELKLAYELRPSPGARFRLTGRVKAAITQTCVISLDPVEHMIDEPIDVELWPDDQFEDIEQRQESDVVSVELEGPEPIVQGQIEVGQVAYEHLVAAIDPYPRKPGTEFKWQDPEASDDRPETVKPFAELRKLMREKEKSAC